jgi:hypothetical protein
MNSDNQRIIGFWRGWSIAVGCAVGSGIFMMPTMLAPYGMLGLGWMAHSWRRLNSGCFNHGKISEKDS